MIRYFNLSFFTIAILLFTLFISCSEQKEIKPWTITDLSQQEKRIALLMEEKPQSLQVKVKASVDGNFKILLRGSDSGHFRQLEFNDEVIDTIIAQEWYSQNCSTTFLPGSARNGDVEIEVKLLSVSNK